MPGKGKFGENDAWTKGASLIDLGNLGKKKEEKAEVSTGNSVYIAAGNAPVKSNFTPMGGMSRK